MKFHENRLKIKKDAHFWGGTLPAGTPPILKISFENQILDFYYYQHCFFSLYGKFQICSPHDFCVFSLSDWCP